MAAISPSYRGFVYDLYSKAEAKFDALTTDKQLVTIEKGSIRCPGNYSVSFDLEGQVVVQDITEARTSLTDSEREKADERVWGRLIAELAQRITNLTYEQIEDVSIATMKDRGIIVFGQGTWSRPSLERLVQVIAIVARKSMLDSALPYDAQVGGLQVNPNRGRLKDDEKFQSDATDWRNLQQKILARLPNLTQQDLDFHPVLLKIRTQKEDGETRTGGVRPTKERIEAYTNAAFQMAFSLPRSSATSSPKSAA